MEQFIVAADNKISVQIAWTNKMDFSELISNTNASLAS